ncbi:MAG: type ISP restriction/modification enzyme [Smithella sp.]
MNSVGIVTSRDEFVIDFDKNALKNRIAQLESKTQNDEIIAQAYDLKDKPNWKLSTARNQIQKLDNHESFINPIQYRPFDNRYIFYHESLVERTRHDVMQHMLQSNLALLTCRQISSDIWQHSLISSWMIDDSLISNRTKERTYIYPLYLYKEKESKKSHFKMLMLFEPEAVYDSENRIPNIDKDVYEKLNKTFKKKLTPEEILYYIYAVFYSNIYREKYAEFLKIDFPRVPFAADYKVFSKMSDIGKQLTDLHLMKSDVLNKPIVKYQGKGDNDRIEKIIYSEEERKIYINKEKYFDNVSPELWNYQIGGYQVLQKYLKYRKDRNMDDPRYYCRIVTAIDKTISLQNQIDEIYDEVEKRLIED